MPDEIVCEKCGKALAVGEWPWCRGSQRDHAPKEQINYAWAFGQFSNDARREAFYGKTAADPFGTVSE